MNLERFTRKSQQAVQDAQGVAARFGHSEVDAEHLLLALLRQEDGLASRLFEKMGVPADSFATRLEAELEKKPRVSGPERTVPARQHRPYD